MKKKERGLGVGDWGLGIGDWGMGNGPIPHPQSPIPNSQFPILPYIYLFKNHFISFFKN